MIPQRVKTAVLARQGGRCAGGCNDGRGRDLAELRALCKRGFAKYLPPGRSAVEFDHIVPRAQGGTDDEANIQALCGFCHHDKTEGERPDWEAPSPSAFANRIAPSPSAKEAACGHSNARGGKPGKVARLQAKAANKNYAG